MTLLDKNEKAWKQRNKALLKQLYSITIDNNIITAETEKQEKIFGIQTTDRVWYLNSRLDPEAAARCYAKRYPPRIYETYFVFGLSDGRHIRELLGQCDDTNHVIVYEPNASFFYLVNCVMDLSDLIADDRLQICVPGVTADIETIMRFTLQDLNFMIMEFCILPGYDVLYHDACEGFMDAIQERLQEEIVHKSTRLTFQRMVPQHTLYNMKHMIGCRNIYQIRQALEGLNVEEIPAILVSAGPSLDKNISELKKAQGKAFIVVVDAALRTVLRAGVRPDMVCTIDPESPDRFFENLDVTDLAWCCNRITRPWVLEHCAKRVYYYGFFEKRWNQILDENMEYPFPDIPSGGCVSATAFALACYLGFRKLILIGQDMAFTGGISHTAGIEGAFGDNDEYIKSRNRIQVEGIDGTMLETDFQMWYYKKWFEKAIRANEGLIEVIDATEGGARIEGTRLMTLKDVVAEYCNRPLPFEEIEKNIPDAYSAETKTKLAAEWHKMRQQIDSIGTQVKQGLAIQEKLLQELRQQRSVAELMPDLKRMMDHNEELEQLPLFGMMVSYAQTEEYALGDEIYQKEEMGIEELVEKNYTLYQGYERAVSLLTEDIEMYA